MGDDRAPVFVDLHGGGLPDDDEPEEPLLRRCWGGREKLWIVFWVYGIFGWGVIIAGWQACIFLGLQIGLLSNPANTDGGFIGAVTGIILGFLAALPFFIWLSVSLWRCAPNCKNRLWGRLVRGWLVAQYVGMGMFAYNYAGKIDSLIHHH